MPPLQVLPIASSEGFQRCSPREPLLVCLQTHVCILAARAQRGSDPECWVAGALVVLPPIWELADAPRGKLQLWSGQSRLWAVGAGPELERSFHGRETKTDEEDAIHQL